MIYPLVYVKHSVACNSEKLEINEMSRHSKLPKRILLHPYEGIVYNC